MLSGKSETRVVTINYFDVARLLRFVQRPLLRSRTAAMFGPLNVWLGPLAPSTADDRSQPKLAIHAGRGEVSAASAKDFPKAAIRQAVAAMAAQRISDDCLGKSLKLKS